MGRRVTVGRRLWWAAALLAAVAAAVVINAPGVSAWVYALRDGPVAAALPAAPPYTAGDRVLVVAPHPDDESLCCAGSILRAEAAGAEVFVVWLTSGDAFEFDAALTERTLHPGTTGLQRLGLRRIGEARAAARVLGVPDDHLTFLDYPDAGLVRMLRGDDGRPYRSPTTGLSVVTYSGALAPGSSFTGAHLTRDLTTVVDRVRPTVVLAPSPEDRHPDHRAAGELTMRILRGRPAASGAPPRAGWWIVHGALEWPLPKGLHPRLPLVPPPRGRGLAWQRVELTPDQVARKRDAIAAHRTQLEAEARFLEAFVRRNELLSSDALPPPRAGGE